MDKVVELIDGGSTPSSLLRLQHAQARSARLGSTDQGDGHQELQDQEDGHQVHHNQEFQDQECSGAD